MSSIGKDAAGDYHDPSCDQRMISTQAHDQSTNVNSGSSSVQTPRQSLPLSIGLLKHTFLLPLVVECLNDGDAITRLHIVNKLIRQMLHTYSFKRMCNVKEAFYIIEASRDIVFSVTRVTIRDIDEMREFHRLQQVNTSPLVEMHYTCYDRSSLDRIPRSVTHLQLSSRDQLDAATRLSLGMIPDSVVDLSIDCDSFIAQPDSIPSSVKTVKMYINLDHFTADVIPNTVTDLTLIEAGDLPARALHGPFPASLKHISMRRQTLPFAAGILPSSVISITCNSKLLSVLEAGAIPNSVKNVDVRWNEECTPKPDVLPDSLTFLDVKAPRGPVRFVPHWLPTRLTHLALDLYNGEIITAGLLPATLTRFQCNCEIEPGALPDGLTHVDLIDQAACLRQDVLPPSVTHLKLISSMPNLTPGLIPSSVTHLEFGCSLEQVMIPGIIPGSVTHLTFNSTFNRPLSSHSLPCSLTYLCFGDAFNMSIRAIIPRAITHLVFGYSFNQPILPGDIPPSVIYLEFAACFTHEFDSSNLPSSLTHITIPRGYLKSDDKLWLPSSITHISYGFRQAPVDLSASNDVVGICNTR